MKLTVLGISLLVGSLFGCSKNPAELQKKFMADGQHYLSEGKVNEAVIEFQNLLKLNPRSAKGRDWLGKAYLKKGWTSEAVQQFQEASKLDPLLLDAHLKLAFYGVNSSLWTAVKPEIAAILRIDPNNVAGWTFSGQRAMALGREDQAQKDLDHALSLDQESVLALVAMGDLKQRQKHPNQAKAYYQKALEKDKNNSRAWTGLGVVAQIQRNPVEAQNDFKKAVQVDPSDLRSQIILSNSLAQQGHVRKAINMLKAIPAKSADLRVTIKIAEYETLIGKNTEAIQLLHPIERQEVQIPDIYFVLAKAYQQSGRPQDALNMVDRLVRLKGVPPILKIAASRIELYENRPDNAKKILDSLDGIPNLPVTYWQTKGIAELGLKHPTQALRILNGALKIYPENPILLLSLVDAQVSQKNYKGAKNTLNALLKITPQNANSIGRMGILLRQTKGVKAELSYYQEKSREYPDNSSIETLYLLAMATNKFLPAAIREASAYMTTHPKNQEIHFLLAQFDLQTGHKNRTNQIYKSLLDENPKNLQVMVALANQDLSNKHYTEAESLFRRALLLSPENANLYANLGRTLLSENQPGEASKDFQKALSYNPNQPDALFAIAKNEILAGQTQQALTHLAPLMKIAFPDQGKAELQWLWGLASEKNGNMGSALDSLEKSVKLDPGNFVYHASLGDLLGSLSQWDKSLAEYDKSLALHPDNPLLAIKKDWVKIQMKSKTDTALVQRVVDRALAYRQTHPDNVQTALIAARGALLLQKPAKALTIFDSILSQKPDNETALIGKAGILLGQGHVRQAGKIVNEVLNTHPNNINGNLMMATIDQKSNNIQGEVDHLERIHQLHPDWVQPALALSSAALSLKRYEEAKSVSFALHEAHPDLSAALYFQASAEMGLKEYREALKNFQSLIRHVKNAGPLYSLMSVAAMKLGDKDGEKRYLGLAFKNSPNDPVILNNMAYYLANNTKDLPKALAYAKKANKLNSQPYIQDTVGYILFQMGDYSKAEPHFKVAYDAKFRDPKFLYHMGMNEWKLGKNDQASDHLRESIVSGKLSPEELEQAHKALRKLSAGA
ncbi:MAG: tetratricopeptide repeat protein [Leptospirales bacterium]